MEIDQGSFKTDGRCMESVLFSVMLTLIFNVGSID